MAKRTTSLAGGRAGSDQWVWYKRVGRLQLRLTVYRHFSHLPARWAFQPEVIYDRKG